MRTRVIVALVLVAAGAALMVSSFRRTVTPYVGFAEARRTDGMVQVSGRIVGRDYVVRPGEQYLSFRLRDREGEEMPVVYRGVVPSGFQQASMVVAVGRCVGDRFEARQLLAKCPAKYQAAADSGRSGP